MTELKLFDGHHFLYLTAVTYQAVGVRAKGIRNLIRIFEL